MEVSDLVADTKQAANEGLQEGEVDYDTEKVLQTLINECPEQILQSSELHHIDDQLLPRDENVSISSSLRAISPTQDLPGTESSPKRDVETGNASVDEDERQNDSTNLVETELKHLEILPDESQIETLKRDWPRPVASISEGEEGRHPAGSEERQLVLTSPPSPSSPSSSSSGNPPIVIGGSEDSLNEIANDSFDPSKPEVDRERVDGDDMGREGTPDSRESNSFESKCLEISDASVIHPGNDGDVSSLTASSLPSDGAADPTKEDDLKDVSSETPRLLGRGKEEPDGSGDCGSPLLEVSADSGDGKTCVESVIRQCPRSLNFETTSENDGGPRKSCGLRSSESKNAFDYDENVPVVLPSSSSFSSSTSSLPSSLSLPSSYDGGRPSTRHNFYDSYKSQSKSSEIQPLQQSYLYSEDHWTNAASLGGVAQNETIKRKQKSLNDIIIRMLNDSSNKVHRAAMEGSNDVCPPPFFKNDSKSKVPDTSEEVDKIVVDRLAIADDEEEDDDEDNDNLEIQIDDDVEIEVADNDGKPSDDSSDDTCRSNVAKGGMTDCLNQEIREKLHQTSNCSLDDFQKLSSSFIQDPDRRGYQEMSDYQMVKVDKDTSRVDILESGYLFPYDSRLYNMHLFEKFLPHAYHAEYKTSSHYHESGHVGRAICNSGVKDHYMVDQDDFGSDAIDLTKNTRPMASSNSFPLKIHDVMEDGSYPSIESSAIESCEKKLNQDHRSVTSEAVSYLSTDGAKVDSSLVSDDMSRGYPGPVALLDAESRDAEDLGRPGNVGRDTCSVSKAKEEDHLPKDGIKGMKACPENLRPPKECESKAFNLPPYHSGADTDKLNASHANSDDYCHAYQYQNAGNKSTKYSLMAEMGNPFYAYYSNAHYNGTMGLYGSMGHCISMSDKMQQSESQQSSSLEAEVLNLAKQDKGTRPPRDGLPSNSGCKSEIDRESDSCSPNEPDKPKMTHFFQEHNANNLEIIPMEDKVQSSKGSLSPNNLENQMTELTKSSTWTSNPTQANSGGALNDQTTYDSRLPQNLQVSSEHHKEMAKTKSMWRDKYLAEDSGLHFTNFSSISRLEQCVSSINYDKPLADKKDRLKLSADVEKELQSFRMGLKMLGDSGMKPFDKREDLSSDRNQNNTPSGRGGSRKSNSNQKALACGEGKRNRRSKSTKESNSKKACPSEFPQDFSIVNNYQMNGHPGHVPGPDYSRDHPRPSRTCDPSEMHGGLYDVNNLSLPETGKKKRGRKKKEVESSMQNIENHFKSSESSNFSEHIHSYGMLSNNFSGYPDNFYNSNINVQQHFRQQHLQHQMSAPNKYSHTLSQTEKLSSPSILKVPDSHLSSSGSSAKKKHAGTSNCSKSNGKDKNKNSAKSLGQVERLTDSGDIDDNESFLCNGASLDIYLNEPKECQKSDSWMEDERQDEEADGKLPFSFDVDQKTFTCHYCSYQVKRKGQLMKHLGGHQVFVCTHCNAKCPDQQKLEEHLLDRHPTRCGRRLCKRCHVLFRLEELERHEIECNGEKQGWTCDLCDKKFRFLSAVKNHVGKWHKNETSKFDARCDDSIKKSKSKSSSEVIGRSAKGVEYVDESTILDEIQIVDLPQLETTSVEMNFFAEASSPNRDSSTDACSGNSSTPSREKQLTYSDKNEGVKSSADLKNEKKVRTFQCETCPKFYRSMQSLKIHRQKKHADFDEKRAESDGTVPSGPATRDASSSEETCNLDAGAGASEGRCDDPSDESGCRDTEGEIASTKECSERGADKLNRHARDDKKSDDVLDDDVSSGMPSSHFPLSDGWFQCTYESCSKRFRKLEQVQKHEERHPIDKIYKCDWPGCRKAYIHYANLYSHRSHHITAKPFICNLCSSAYWQKCSLNSHKARVHGIKNLPNVPGPKADGRRVDKPCLDACDDDSKTITSNVSDSETNGFLDREKSENGAASLSSLMHVKDDEVAGEDEEIYDRNSYKNKRDDNNNHIALLKDAGKKRTKSVSKEDAKGEPKDDRSEMNKSESSRNSSNNERAERHGKEVCNSRGKKSSTASEKKSPRMEMDKSEVSQASTNNQEVAGGKKKRGRKPKNTKSSEEKETADKETRRSDLLNVEKQNALDVPETSGYKITESRCVVEELLLSTKVPLNQCDPEEMTPLEVALVDLGAREIESCDDASFGTERTKTKRKIRTSLNYRKKSKLAKKCNQEVAAAQSEMSARPSVTSSTVVKDDDVSICNDRIKAQKEQPILPDCKDESKTEVAADMTTSKEVRSMDGNLDKIVETIEKRTAKIPDVPRLNLDVESQNSETMTSLTTGDKSVVGNVYEFCESEGEECMGSNKSAVKKNLPTKKSEIKDSSPKNERRETEDSDDNASLDFKLSRSKPLKTYLDRPKKKIPSCSYSVDSSSSASLTGEESLQCGRSKRKRKLKYESPEVNQPLDKKLKGDLPAAQNDFSFDADDRERCAVNDQQDQQANKEVSEGKMVGKGKAVPQPTPAKKASKRRKNEVEVLLEDTLSRPATADKKSSSGRLSKRSELFNFERSLSSKPEVKNSPETKKAEIKTTSQKKSSKGKDGAVASEGAEKNATEKLEPESSKAVPSPFKDTDSRSSEVNSETRSRPIESRLAKKRKAESLVPIFYNDTLQLKEDCMTLKKDLGNEHMAKETVSETPNKNCSSNVLSTEEVAENIPRIRDDIQEVACSNIQTRENSVREELMPVAVSPQGSNPNVVLKLQIGEIDQTAPMPQMAQENKQVTEQESDGLDRSQLQSSTETFDCNDAMVSVQAAAESSKPEDAAKAPSRGLTEDNDSQLSLIDSLEYLRIGEVDRPALASERFPDMPHPVEKGEPAIIPCRQSSVVSPDATSHLEKQPDNAFKEDDYCMEDADDNGGFVKPSEPPSTWRNYDYEDTGYEPQSERKRFEDKAENVSSALQLENGQEEAQMETNKANSSTRENGEPDKLSHFGRACSPEKDGFCSIPSQSTDQDSEVKGRKESHMSRVGSESDGFPKSSSIPDPVPLRIGLEEVDDKIYQAKNQGFEHPDATYSADQFRNGMATSRPISPFNHSKELSHPVSSLHRKDSKLSVDTLAEGQPYSTACSSSYFDYQAMAGKRSDPHPLSSLESLATLAPSAGLGGYFDSVVPPEKRLSNDLNKPPRSNNFHPEIPPPPPPHTPFPANPYRNFSGYEADLALLGANRHKGYRYNERPFDPSLSVPYGYDRPDLHHPSYHMGSNFAPPDSRFFSQFLQSADAVDQRYYMGQQGGFGDFHKTAASSVAGDPKNKFASTSFTSLLTGSPYSGLSDSYLSSLTPNISNAPSLTANELGNYSRGEGWNSERPWTAVPPSSNDPSIQYQQQQPHSSSRKQQQQQQPPNDYEPHASKKTPSSSSASVRGSGDTHFYNSYDTSSPRLRNLATPGPPPAAPSGHKRLEEAYRQAAAIMSSDYNQHHPHPSLIQPTPNPATDVYGPVDPMMNPAAFPSFNRYYYSAARDAVYRSQQRLAAMHHHQQQQQQPHPHNPSLSPFSNAVNLAGFPTPGYPPDPFAPLPASTAGMPYSSKNQHYPGSRGVHGNGGGAGKHHQNQIPPLASTGAPPLQTTSKNSKSSKAILPPLGLGGMAPSFDHLNSSNFLHQQNPAIPPDPYRQSVIYNMIPKYF